MEVPSLTSVDTNAQLQLMVRQMTYAKHDHVTEELQCHACYLTRVFEPVQLGATADNHVRITDSLHLQDMTAVLFKIEAKWSLSTGENYYKTYTVVLIPMLERFRGSSN